MMRHVAMVTRYPPAGTTHIGRGIGSYSKQLAQALVESGWRVSVLAERREGKPSSYMERGVEIRRVWTAGFGTRQAIVSAVKACRPSAIIVQYELFAFGRRLAVLTSPLTIRHILRL